MPHPRLTFRTVNIVFTCPCLSYSQYYFYRSTFIVQSILLLYVNICRTVNTSFIRQYLSYCQYFLSIVLSVLPLYVNIYRTVNTSFIRQYLSYCQYFLYKSIFIVLSIRPLKVNIYRNLNTAFISQYLSTVNTAFQVNICRTVYTAFRGEHLLYCQYCLYKVSTYRPNVNTSFIWSVFIDDNTNIFKTAQLFLINTYSHQKHK